MRLRNALGKMNESLMRTEKRNQDERGIEEEEKIGSV